MLAFQLVLLAFQLVLLLFEQHLLHALRLRELVEFLRDAAELRAGRPVRLAFLRLTPTGGFDLAAGPVGQAARVAAGGGDGLVDRFALVVADRVNDRLGQPFMPGRVG